MALKARSRPTYPAVTKRQFEDLRAVVRANQRTVEDLRREVRLTILRCAELQREIDALKHLLAK